MQALANCQVCQSGQHDDLHPGFKKLQRKKQTNSAGSDGQGETSEGNCVSGSGRDIGGRTGRIQAGKI